MSFWTPELIEAAMRSLKGDQVLQTITKPAGDYDIDLAAGRWEIIADFSETVICRMEEGNSIPRDSNNYPIGSGAVPVAAGRAHTFLVPEKSNYRVEVDTAGRVTLIHRAGL